MKEFCLKYFLKNYLNQVEYLNSVKKVRTFDVYTGEQEWSLSYFQYFLFLRYYLL